MIVDRMTRQHARQSRFFLAALSLAVVASAILSPSSALAEDFRPGKLRFEDYVPDDCYAFASFEGLGACDRALTTTGLYKTWQEPEVQDFVRGMVGMVRQRLAEQPMPEHVRQVRAALQGRIGVAVGDLTLVGLRAASPAFVIGVDTGNRTEAFHQVLHEVLVEVTGKIGVQTASFDYAGRTIYSVPLPELPRTQICFTQADNLFLVGLNKYYLQRVLATHAAGGKGGLTASEPYRRSLSHVGSGTALLSFFLNIDGARKKLGGITPPEFVELARFVGLDGVRALYGASTIDGVGARDFWYVDAPGEKRGLMKVAAAMPIGDDAARTAPFETIYFADMTFDLTGAVDHLLGLADMVYPPARHQFEVVRGEFRQRFGFDMYDEGIKTLGNGLSISVSMPSTGGLVPEILATIELEHPDRFERSMQSAISRLGGEVRSVDYEGSRLTYMTLNPQVPFTPTYAISGKTLYLSGAPLLLKSAMRNKEGGGKSLADNPRFREVSSRLRSEPSSLEYLDIPRAVSLTYATGAPFLQAMQGKLSEKQLPIDLAMLPTTDALTRHLTGMARAYGSDANGLYSETYSPVGLATVLAAGARMINSLEGVPSLTDVAWVMPGDRARRALAAAERDRAEAERRMAEAAAAVARSSDHGTQASEEDVAAFVAGVRSSMAAAKGREAFQRAFQAHTARDFDRSIAGFLQAAELGFERSTCYYNIACGYALQGQADRAFEWLDKAVEAGFRNKQLLSSDADLNHIRGDARFKKYLQGR